MKIQKLWSIGIAAVSLMSNGCVAVADRHDTLQSGSGSQSPCPDWMPPGETCYAGQDKNGAYYLIAMPAGAWNNTLFIWARGGPSQDPPAPIDMAWFAPASALGLLNEGYAMAATSYRIAGFGIPIQAEDVDNLRQIFVDTIGQPGRTYVEGTSYGGNVATKLAEIYGSTSNYDAVMTNCGVVDGPLYTNARYVDLRVVYQYYCNNLPLPSETDYPLWQGLDRYDPTSDPEIGRRVGECTGVPGEERTPEQQQNYDDISNVLRLPSVVFRDFLLGNVTKNLRAFVRDVTNWSNASPNYGVEYQGSHDDAALNAGVTRYDADPTAVDMLVSAMQPTGNLPIPISTVANINDPNVIAQHENRYHEIVERAGSLDRLRQSFISGAVTHCGFSKSEFEAVFHTTEQWVETGNKPSDTDIQATCEHYQKLYGDACRFDFVYQPGPVTEVIYAREFPGGW
jgi:hypothetical protein